MQPSWNLPFSASWHFQGWRHRSWIYSWDRLSWTLYNGTWCSVEWKPWGWRRSLRQSAPRVPSRRSPWSPYRKGRRCCTMEWKAMYTQAKVARMNLIWYSHEFHAKKKLHKNHASNFSLCSKVAKTSFKIHTHSKKMLVLITNIILFLY